MVLFLMDPCRAKRYLALIRSSSLLKTEYGPISSTLHHLGRPQVVWGFDPLLISTQAVTGNSHPVQRSGNLTITNFASSLLTTLLL